MSVFENVMNLPTGESGSRVSARNRSSSRAKNLSSMRTSGFFLESAMAWRTMRVTIVGSRSRVHPARVANIFLSVSKRLFEMPSMCAMKSATGE